MCPACQGCPCWFVHFPCLSLLVSARPCLSVPCPWICLAKLVNCHQPNLPLHRQLLTPSFLDQTGQDEECHYSTVTSSQSERLGESLNLSVQCGDESRNYFRKCLIFGVRHWLTDFGTGLTEGFFKISLMVPLRGLRGWVVPLHSEDHFSNFHHIF